MLDYWLRLPAFFCFLGGSLTRELQGNGSNLPDKRILNSKVTNYKTLTKHIHKQNSLIEHTANDCSANTNYHIPQNFHGSKHSRFCSKSLIHHKTFTVLQYFLFEDKNFFSSTKKKSTKSVKVSATTVSWCTTVWYIIQNAN